MDAFTARPELSGIFGAVGSTHWIASACGMKMLEAGGNAFDAAAATGFVLQIVEPHLNGPGGDVPILLGRHDDTEPTVICGQGGAPAAATLEAFAALGLDLIPGTGLLAACIPGAFGAWLTLLRDWGTLPLRSILEAGRIAETTHGGSHPLLPGTVDTIAWAQWSRSGGSGFCKREGSRAGMEPHTPSTWCCAWRMGRCGSATSAVFCTTSKGHRRRSWTRTPSV